MTLVHGPQGGLRVLSSCLERLLARMWSWEPRLKLKLSAATAKAAQSGEVLTLGVRPP